MRHSRIIVGHAGYHILGEKEEEVFTELYTGLCTEVYDISKRAKGQLTHGQTIYRLFGEGVRRRYFGQAEQSPPSPVCGFVVYGVLSVVEYGVP